jgi:omega-amidase
MKTNLIKTGIIQFDVQLGDVQGNLKRVTKQISRLAEKGVQLVLVPEMWSTGFAYDQLRELADTTHEVLAALARLAKAVKVAIIGSVPEKGRGVVYNTAYVVDRNGTVSPGYRKVHLFSVTGEDRHFKSGQQAVVVETTLGPIGLMICYDLRFPELCRALCCRGAKIVAVPAQWPTPRIAHWKTLLKARAIENQLFVLGANRCGQDRDMVYGGHSCIVSPWGEVLAKAGKGPANITAVLDLGTIERVRNQIPCLRDRVTEAYG